MICLIRHGMTEANERRLYCGSSDLPLSANGRAALMKKRVEGEYPAAAQGLLISSGMRRCNETAELLFGRAPDRIAEDLREIDFGAFELHSYDELCADPAYQSWITDESGEAAPPEGEPSNAFKKRVIAAMKDIPDNAVIICHGGVIACLMAHWFPEEGRHMYAWQPEFGSGYLIDGIKSYTKIPTIIQER